MNDARGGSDLYRGEGLTSTDVARCTTASGRIASHTSALRRAILKGAKGVWGVRRCEEILAQLTSAMRLRAEGERVVGTVGSDAVAVEYCGGWNINQRAFKSNERGCKIVFA